jgi:TolB-like protein/DNA-binding winged helix-turn-helix (wHTH) protein/Tfp pilus assembly protein PilF
MERADYNVFNVFHVWRRRSAMAGRFMVGAWTVAPELNSLERDQRTVHLEPKIMQVLVTLAEHPGEVLSKQHMLDRVWPETFVSDEVLTRSVSELRKVFEDNPREPTYIQTIPKSGYRLMAPVVEEAADHADALHVHRWRQKKKWMLLTAVAIILLTALGSFYLVSERRSAASRPRITSLAVLPLTNLSGDTSQDYFADGMTEELITDLSQISALKVISRTSIMQYKKTNKPLPQIARELGVDAVVVGSVRRSGERVRVTAQLIYAPQDQNLWAQSYERDWRDILTLQSAVARAIANRIHVALTPKEYTRLYTTRPVKPEAHDAYLKALFFWRMASSDEDFKKSLPFFEEAVKEDPNYALAYAGLASIYMTLEDRVLSPEVAKPKAKVAAEKALELDNSLAQAHIAMAGVHDGEWNLTEAEQEYRRAIELSPNNALAHVWYGEDLVCLERTDEGIAEIRKALDLDPLSIALHTDLAWRLYMARRFDESIAQARHVLELDPNSSFAHQVLGSDYEQQRNYSEAVAEWHQAFTLEDKKQLATALVRAYKQSGYSGAMQAWLRSLMEKSKREYVSPLKIAELYVLLGNNDQAFIWLEKAFQQETGDLIQLKVYPLWDPLRSDPRFADLVRRVGLPP